ncbi:MAG: hypothetical protein ACT4PG_09235 [Panacagrimonas sp.]
MRYALLLWAALRFAPASASAQDDDAAVYDTIPLTAEAAAEPTEQAEPQRAVLGEVVVTTTKRASDIRDIPLSIDAFSDDELTTIGAMNLVGTNLTNVFEPAVVFGTPNTGGILTIFNPPRFVPAADDVAGLTRR